MADEGGRVVGFGRLHIEGQGLAIVRGVFVDSEFVGRGIGSQIVDRLLAIAAKFGVTTVDLVATLNARTFYERLGFRFVERVRHTTPNGAVIPGFHMRREAMTRTASG